MVCVHIVIAVKPNSATEFERVFLFSRPHRQQLFATGIKRGIPNTYCATITFRIPYTITFRNQTLTFIQMK